MKITVNDIYGTEVSLSMSNSGYYRFDFKNERDFPEREHMGDKIPNCLSFDEDEARILHHALKLMIEKNQ